MSLQNFTLPTDELAVSESICAQYTDLHSAFSYVPSAKLFKGCNCHSTIFILENYIIIVKCLYKKVHEIKLNSKNYCRMGGVLVCRGNTCIFKENMTSQYFVINFNKKTYNNKLTANRN